MRLNLFCSSDKLLKVSIALAPVSTTSHPPTENTKCNCRTFPTYESVNVDQLEDIYIDWITTEKHQINSEALLITRRL